MNNISPNNINTSLNISSKYSNVEINPILKANIKALLEFLKAKFNNSIDLEKAEKFAYNRGLIDEKGHLTEKGMEILTVLFRLFPDIDFTNSDVIKSIDIDSILRKLETLSQNSTSGNECCQQEPTVANFETEYKSFANFEKDVPTFANFENKMPIVANNELAKVGIANNELAKVGIANNTMINMTNMDDVLCVILNKFDILKEDIRKLANEIRKEKKISKTFGKSSFYDIMKWLLTDKCVDTRYIAENIKNLNASLGSYKADLAYLNKIGWIYEDLDGLYKLNVEKFLSDLERAGLINKLHYERELENASYNEIWDLDQKYYSLNVDENGVFKFEFGDKTLEQYYLSSMILNETKVLINRLQKEYFKNWRKENLKEIVDCEDDTLLFPLIKCHFTNIPISATECIQYPDPSKVGKLVVVEAEILEATPIKNIVICGEYSEYLDDDEPHIEYFDLNTKKIPETIKIKTEDGVKELKLIRKYIHTVQEFLLQQPIDELNPKEEPKPIKGVWIGAEGLFDIGAKVRIVGILDIDKSDRPISPYVIRILRIEEIEEFSYGLSEEDIKIAKEYYESRGGDLFKIADDLLPNIIGNKLLKVAILLQLCNVESEPRDGFNWNLHILLVGDPSTGKSRILKRVYNLFPNNQYVDLTNATQAGLVGAMEAVKGYLGEVYTFKRGAMPKANGAVLCLDEKGNKDTYKYFNTSMEDGFTTVKKRGRDIKLKTNCAYLWACNPKKEKFDLDKTITEQIDIPESILSRFDIVVALFNQSKELNEIEDIIDAILGEGEKDKVDDDVLRRYILYARTFNPKIPKEIRKEIAKYYHQLQGKSYLMDARVVKSLLKLVRAIAKAHLRNEVMKEDFELAKKIYQMYLDTVLYDPESGVYDFGKLGKATKSEREKMDKIVEIIKEIAKDRADNLVPQTEIEEKAKEMLGIDENEVERLLKKLEKIGEIHEPRAGIWGVL
ncbi:MCM family protein (plasmid) [Methanocaldococcus sp. 28A]